MKIKNEWVNRLAAALCIHPTSIAVVTIRTELEHIAPLIAKNVIETCARCVAQHADARGDADEARIRREVPRLLGIENEN